MTETSAEKAHVHIAETISAHPIVLFMKGTLRARNAAFSASVVEVLRHYDAPVHAIDSCRSGRFVKRHHQAATIPQLYVNAPSRAL